MCFWNKQIKLQCYFASKWAQPGYQNKEENIHCCLMFDQNCIYFWMLLSFFPGYILSAVIRFLTVRWYYMEHLLLWRTNESVWCRDSLFTAQCWCFLCEPEVNGCTKSSMLDQRQRTGQTDRKRSCYSNSASCFY